jgi:acetyl esterase
MNRPTFRPRSTAALVVSASLAATTVHAGSLDPATDAFVSSLSGGAPIYTLAPDAARTVLSELQASAPVRLPEATVVDRTLPVGPTGTTRVRIVSPPAASRSARPAIIYIHGGGWVLGGPDTHDRLVRELAVGTGAVLVLVDYDRSPEARFPVAIEQSYAVLTHLAQHAAEFGIDPVRIAIAGDSVGGNMAAVVAMMAKVRKGPGLVAQALFYPVTDASMSTASYTEFADGPWLTAKGMAWFWDQYLPDAAQRENVYASPVNAFASELEGLPPALVIVDENDVLRDEGEAYARQLAAAGVPVTAVRYNGTTHDFMMLNPIAETPAVRAAVGQAAAFLRQALSSAD